MLNKIADLLTPSIIQAIWTRPGLSRFRRALDDVIEKDAIQQLVQDALAELQAASQDELPHFFDEGFLRMPAVQHSITSFIVDGHSVEAGYLADLYAKRFLPGTTPSDIQPILDSYLQQLRRTFLADPQFSSFILANDHDKMFSKLDSIHSILLSRPEKLARHDKPIFISYARRDGRLTARILHAHLTELGFTLWQDVISMAGGENWWLQIEQAIRESAIMLMVMSDGALASEIVRKEWATARRLGTHILPITTNSGIFTDAPRWLNKLDVIILDETHPDYEQKWSSLIDQLNNPKPRLPRPYTMPNLPEFYVNRPNKVNELLDKILDDDQQNPIAVTSALQGGGGFGKTTLAIAVCHNPAVMQSYDDGILWIQFRENMRQEDLLALLNQILDLLEHPKTYTEIDVAGITLKDYLDDRDILVVLDDVWQGHYLTYFIQSKSTTYLITSRLELVADTANVRPENRISIGEMELDEGLEMLIGWMDELPQNLLPFQELVTRCDGYTLMLEIIGTNLRQRVWRGMSIEKALEDVNRRLELRGFTGLINNTANEERYKAVEVSLRLSLDLLEELGTNQYPPLADLDQRFIELGIFPEDTTIPLSPITTLWSEFYNDLGCEDALDLMHSLSLFTRYDPIERSFRLHDVIRTTAQHLLGTNKADVHRRLLSSWIDVYNLPDGYAWRNIAYHLIEADQSTQLRNLLLDYDFLQAKINATDVNELIADCNYLSDNPSIRVLRNALQMSAHNLRGDKSALAHQLAGRLAPYYTQMDGIRQFLDRVIQQPQNLFPLDLTSKYVTLNPADGVLQATMKHTDSVLGVIQLHDGCLLSWSIDHTLRLWSHDGQHIHTLIGHTDSVLGAIQLHDGRLLSWGRDQGLKIWSHDGQHIHTLIGHTAWVLGAIQLYDGRLLSWSDDKTLHLWDANGQHIHTLQDYVAPVRGAIELQDGHLLSWSDDTTLNLWTSNGQHIQSLEGHTATILGVIELQNGHLLSWSKDHILNLWISNGQLITSLNKHADWVNGAIELNDGRLLSWSDDTTLCLWTADGLPIHSLEGHMATVLGAIELQNGRLLSWSRDHTLRLWSYDGQSIQVLRGHAYSVSGAIELQDGRLLSWSDDTTLRLWTSDGLPIHSFQAHTAWIKGAIELYDGRLLSWSRDHTLRLWSHNEQPTHVLQGHSRSINGISQLRDRRLLSWSNDATLRLWSYKGQHTDILQGHSTWVNGAIELNDGRLLSWSRDHTLRLWTSDGQPLYVFPGHNRSINGAIQLNDGRLLSWSDDNTLRLWDTNGQPIQILHGHTDWVRGAIELNDGRLLSWSRDHTLCLWSHSKQLIHILQEHDRSINGAIELSDGRFLSWSDDKTLRLWDIDGQPIQILHGHTDWVRGAIELNDGRFLSWSDDKTLRLWDIDGQQLYMLDEDYYMGNLSIIISWANQHGIDQDTLYSRQKHPYISENFRVTLRDQLIVYEAHTGIVHHIFYGDGRFTSLDVIDNTIIAGDMAGRILFLRWTSEEQH